jgi:hypothetical protein
MTIQTIVLYLLIKFSAYAWWCNAGLVRTRQKPDTPEQDFLGKAFGLGLFRSLLGGAFGVAIYFLTVPFMAVNSHLVESEFLAYALVYIPVRWIEWSIIAMILYRESRSLSGFIIGGSASDRKWRAAGILISCAADIPVIAALHGTLFLGRVMC